MKQALFAILLAATAGFAQTFEVASVRPSSPPDRDGAVRNWGQGTGSVVLRRISLFGLLREAYGLHNYQISGPDWLPDEFYDILASAPAGTPKAEILRMLQGLLMERFQMTVHRETEERPVYTLTVGENGPQFATDRPAFTGEIGTTQNRDGNRVSNFVNETFGRQRMTISPERYHYEFEGLSMTALERFLNNGYLDLPVLDRTGLKGAYPLTLDIPMSAGGIRNAEPSRYSVEDSLRKQGIELTRTRGLIEKLVIDRVSKTPTEN